MPSRLLIELAVWSCMPWKMMMPSPGVVMVSRLTTKPCGSPRPQRGQLVLDQQLGRVPQILLHLADADRPEADAVNGLGDQQLGEEVDLAGAAAAPGALVAGRRHQWLEGPRHDDAAARRQPSVLPSSVSR